jgi:type IV secretory pathway TraG/TraD family ATPase VirD4
MGAMQQFEKVAALWEHAHQKISLKHWAKHGESLLILGSNLNLMQPLQRINAAALKFISTSILSEPESPGTTRLWFFCDDLVAAGQIDALPTLLNARSRGVRCSLSFQEIERLDALYGKCRRPLEFLSGCFSRSSVRVRMLCRMSYPYLSAGVR